MHPNKTENFKTKNFRVEQHLLQRLANSIMCAVLNFAHFLYEPRYL